MHGLASPVLLVHVATAPLAMRRLLPALPTALWRPSFDATWAACAAVTAAYAPGPPRSDAPRRQSEHHERPDDLMDLRVDHGDEHVIKLADTVLDVHATTGDTTVLAAASVCAELISRPA